MGILFDELDEVKAENKSLRAAIAAWVSAKDAEAAFWHEHRGDDLILEADAEVLAMERAIDDAEDGLRAIVAEKGG